MKHREIQRTQSQPSWWDPYSCQPYKMKSEEKPRSGVSNIFEYVKVALSNLIGLPFIVLQYLALSKKHSSKSATEFIGLSVALDLEYAPQMFVVNVLQSRDSVTHLDEWQHQTRSIVGATRHLTKTYWIGNAVNRTKWGCVHSGQALDLQEKAEELRAEFQGIKLLGSSIIDFEPLLSWRTLWNLRKYRLEGNAALLYVNRRHSPYGTQYGIFDLENKLRLAKAMTRLSNRCDDRLWITETNWPLLDTKPYTPNSGNPSRTCDEATQAEYLKMYYQIAWQTGWVEKVYWWQLINPGYGLVDHRDGSLRKMPSYYALKELLSGELSSAP